MSFGEGDLHVRVAQLMTENGRLRQQVEKLLAINRELCVEANLKDARIRDLESLVRDWAMAPCAVCDPWDEHFACEHFDGCECALGVRMTELGIVWEVG